MGKKRVDTHDDHLKLKLERRVSAGVGPVPVVPVVKFSCPNLCVKRDIYTYGKRGRIGYHRCNVCGQAFKSWELSADDVARFLPHGGHEG